MDAPPFGRRLAAATALLSLASAVVLAAVGMIGDGAAALLATALVLAAGGAGWLAVTRAGRRRRTAVVAGGLGLAGALAAVVVGGDRHGLVVAAVLALLALAVASARTALAGDGAAVPRPGPRGIAVRPARCGVLLVNPRSGAAGPRDDLLAAARGRGMDPIVLAPGDDLRRLAEQAIAAGADVIGMAGGDGSQAVVAAVAADHGVAFVCVPAGTRNHFALDLGLDRSDAGGALAAFGHAVERRVDLATVNGRPFVNNVSLGLYGRLVQQPGYRAGKRRTAADQLPGLLGPTAPASDLRFVDPDGRVHHGARVIQVSNNPYRLSPALAFGSRPRLDSGALGVAALHLNGDRDVLRAVALEATGRRDRFRGWVTFSAPSFTVRSTGPVDAAVDGEAAVLDPPLVFRSRPAALRVRVPLGVPGHSPAARAPAGGRDAVRILVRLAVGRRPPAAGDGAPVDGPEAPRAGDDPVRRTT